MKLCISSGVFGYEIDDKGLAHEKNLSLIREIGFEEVDFGFSTNALFIDGWENVCRERAKAIRDAGLYIRYAHIPFGYPAEGNEAAWKVFKDGSFRAMDLAAELGVDCAAIHPRTSMREDYDHNEEHDKSVEFMCPYCEHAKQAGLTLALEIMRGAGKSAPARIRRYGTDVNDLLTLANELDTGICWDTGHANISMQDQYKSIKKIAPRLKMLHVNDNFAEDDIHIVPFLGNLDWKGFAKAIAETGFDGSLNMELDCGKLPEAMKLHYVRAMFEADCALRDMISSFRA